MATATKQPPIKQPSKSSTTVRISEQSHRSLRELAAQSGEPMQTVLDKAIEEHRRQRFWAEMNAAYAVIQNDPQALAAEKEERALWETTLMDGLDPNEVWTEDDIVRSPEEQCA
jgi:hypothetical protein